MVEVIKGASTDAFEEGRVPEEEPDLAIEWALAVLSSDTM
jgi:hypothetical protein